MNKDICDVAIIGSGVAGMSAGIYAIRYEMNTIIFGNEFGGTIAKTHIVENYPGFESISGMELGNKIQAHLESVSGKINLEEIKTIKKENDLFALNENYHARSVIIASGTVPRKLKTKNIEKFHNKGVSYCATCDGPLFRGKVVGVVGGSDSAAKEALLLAKYAQKFYRREEIRAEPVNKRRVLDEKKIEIINNVNIIEAKGENLLGEVILDNGQAVSLQGLFVEIGSIPNSKLARDLGVECNQKGEILTDSNMRTNVAGVFAAGDIVSGHFKQAIVSASQGSLAAESAFQYLS